MMSKKQGKFVSWRLIPMDLARLVLLWLPLFFRFRRYDTAGAKYKKKIRGGALIVANHSSMTDPFLVWACLWYRRVSFLAAEAVMRNPIIAWLLRGCGCIKIDRNISDIEAVRKAVDVLQDKRIVAMFPQGAITHEEEFSQIKSGAILIALRAGVPIVPMYSNRKNTPWYRPTVVVMGEPLDCRDYCKKKMPTMAEIEAASAALLDRLEECRKTYMALEGNHE